MRIQEILTESKSADLYHGTVWADSILASGSIKPTLNREDYPDDPDAESNRPYISLTRDSRFANDIGYPTVLVIDQAKLTTSHKMKPIDALEPMGVFSPGLESEERVYKPIPISYIKQIIVIDPAGEEMLEEIQQLAAKHNIPMVIQEGLNEHHMVWKRNPRNGKVAIKWRCSSGPRKGRTVPSVAACSAAPDPAKSQRMKTTRQRTKVRQARKAKKTKRVNPASRLSAMLNKKMKR